MFSLLIIIIYLVFISLGFSTPLLGSGWPVMHTELGVPVSYAGIISMIIAGGTIISGLLANRVTRRFGTQKVVALCLLITAASLFGFSLSGSFIILCLLAIPYGLCSGAIDVALNQYVALHYTSKHMSWLHFSWSFGSAISPYIMGYCLTAGRGWSAGYRWVTLIQIIVTVILFVSLPLWKRKDSEEVHSINSSKVLSVPQALGIKGVKAVLISLFAYCGIEGVTGLWASSYLVEFQGLHPEVAATFASLFFIGVTAGRLISGFIADKTGDKLLIRVGTIIVILGIALVAIPFVGGTPALIGLIVIGLGTAPIFPSIIHSTPSNFGAGNSQAIIGIQMASAFTGLTFMPPLFGFIAGVIGIWVYPLFLLLLAVLMLVTSEMLNRKLTVETNKTIPSNP